MGSPFAIDDRADHDDDDDDVMRGLSGVGLRCLAGPSECNISHEALVDARTT